MYLSPTRRALRMASLAAAILALLIWFSRAVPSHLTAWLSAKKTDELYVDLHWAIWAVIIGVIIEEIKLLHHFLKFVLYAFTDRLSEAFAKAWKHKDEVFEGIGFAVLVGGLLFELEISQFIETAQKSEMAVAQNSAAHALERAANAERQAGELGFKVGELPTFVAQRKQEITDEFDNFIRFAKDQKLQSDALVAEFNSTREKLEKARREAQTAAEGTKKDLADMEIALNRERDLQRRVIVAMTPREFSKAQESTFIEHLSPFRGLIVDVWYFQTTTPDAAKFATSIVRLLTDAHWIARGPAILISGYGSNISILKRTDASASAGSAIAVLLKEFNVDGLPAGPQPDFAPDDQRFKYGFNVSTDTRNPDVIIVVGNKQ